MKPHLAAGLIALALNLAPAHAQLAGVLGQGPAPGPASTAVHDLGRRLRSTGVRASEAVLASVPSKSLPPRTLYVLAALSMLEAGADCQEERLDVAQVVFNRVHASGYGASVEAVAFAPGQFQPFFGRRATDFDSRREVEAALVHHRGYSRDRARLALLNFTRDLADPARMREARSHVGGRTSFKGTSMYAYRVAGEDPLRRRGCNFFHIEPGQSYAGLARLEARGPLRVTAPGVSPATHQASARSSLFAPWPSSTLASAAW